MKKIKWCLKKGIRLIEPNLNLKESYIYKAKESVKVMNLLKKDLNNDWAIITAYYARYDIIYAFLMQCGIKSEIHDCSIALIDFLLVKQNFIDKQLVNQIEISKEQRIKLQYYANKKVLLEERQRNINAVHDFILAFEKLMEEIDDKSIRQFREKLRKLIK